MEASKQEHGEQVVRTRKLSYFSRNVNVETFDRLALAETYRRGIENAGQVVVVMDGAVWEKGFIDHHCSQAICILDFAHATEHIGMIGASLYEENTAEAHARLDEYLHTLKHTRPDEILAEVRDLQEKFPENRKSQVIWLISKSVSNKCVIPCFKHRAG